jgi:hypothetical protein
MLFEYKSSSKVHRCCGFSYPSFIITQCDVAGEARGWNFRNFGILPVCHWLHPREVELTILSMIRLWQAKVQEFS